jgi:hypothetical protein
MRLPRVRFTVRRMIVVVAVIAAVLGGGIEVERLRRPYLYRQEAAKFAGNGRYWYERFLDYQQAIMGSKKLTHTGDSSTEEMAEAEMGEAARRYREIIWWSSKMKEKYERAASRPWESVPPGPPRPWDPSEPVPIYRP